MGAIWISIVLLLLAKNAISEYDSKVCKIFTESYGLIPPPLPRNFEMKAEVVDHVHGYAAYQQIYFDYTNSRAKYTQLINTTEMHYLFDYETQQVVEWIRLHPEVSMTKDPLSLVCSATDMDESSVTAVFGYQDYLSNRPKMFNSNEMLRFGGQYLYAANGSEKLDDRNLQVNKFIGCVFDSFANATLLNEFDFADTDSMEPSGGTPASLLTANSEMKPLSVPVKIHMEGIIHSENKAKKLHKTMSISWFKGKPDFHSDTFRLPPWVHCKDYRGRKEIPKLPNAFSTRVVITAYSVDILGELVERGSDTSFERIFYDADKLLGRRDYTPNRRQDTEIFSKFGSYTPVSTIYDFNEGLKYGINKASGRCFIQPISENEYFDTEEESLYRKLATPEEMFRMQMDDMEYKGKTFARDVMCDVWNGKHFHKLYNTTLIKETYFSTDGWHEIADGLVEYSVPIKHLLISESLDANLTESVIAYNFLKFKAKPPALTMFDIKNCVEQINHKRFAIQLLNADDLVQTIFQYKLQFLEAAQLYIANKTGVHTPLRVQRLHLRHLSSSKPIPFLVFSILDKANLKNLPIVVTQKGKSFEEAITVLQKLVESGKFVVTFNNPNTNEVVEMPSGQSTLYTLTDEGVLTQAPQYADDGNAGTDEPYNIIYEKHIGMTAGHLALLAFAMLFIGFGIGVSITYLYIRIKSDERNRLEQSVSMRDTEAAVAANAE